MYSLLYAKMCQALSTREAPSSTNPNETTDFRRLLLGRCQREFEEDSSGFVETEMKKMEIEENGDVGNFFLPLNPSLLLHYYFLLNLGIEETRTRRRAR